MFDIGNFYEAIGPLRASFVQSQHGGKASWKVAVKL